MATKAAKKKTTKKAAKAPVSPRSSRKDIMKKHQRHDKDTGSAAVQVALQTDQIERVKLHLEKNKNDKHSRRGLLGLVAKRRQNLRYLEENEPKVYEKTVKNLGLRK